MPKKKITAKIDSYGIYTKWNRSCSDLPKIRKFTTNIPAIVDIEFGILLIIKKGKGRTVKYRIDHPPFEDSSGSLAPPFEGEVWINSNDYKFFIGDTIWEPINNKTGSWTISVCIDNLEIAKKTFNIVEASTDDF